VFVTWGRGPTEVEMALDDGTYITHRQGRYCLKNGKKELEWSATGTVVPDAVIQALNLSELSWQSQMDAPFLLSASPGEVARMLNEVADLNKIDSTLVNINRMARDNRGQLTECAQQKQRLEIDLSEFRELDNQLTTIVQLKEMDRKAGLLEGMVSDGDRLVCSITDQEETLTHYKDVEKHLILVHMLNKLVVEAEILQGEAEAGQSRLDEVKELNLQLKKIKDPSDAEAELDLLLDMEGQFKSAQKSIGEMEKQIVAIVKVESYLKHATEQLELLETQWHERSKGKCPLCGRSD